MSKNKILIPEFRFPEFANDDDWVEKKLGEIAENLDSRRVPITSTQREVGHIPYYGASGIIDYVKDYIFNEMLLCISEDGANLIDRNYPIAFSISGRTWVNNHSHVLKFKNINIQKIVETYINSINIEKFLTGMAQPKLNRGKLDIIPIPLPKNLEEQQKIASCLSSLDEMIAAHGQKLELFKDHKKGLMQNLFPQQGEKVPKYRFPKFVNDSEWEVKTLGNYLIRPPEYGINAPAVPYSDKLPTYLRITDISEDGRFLSNDKVSVDREVTENNYLSEGDIVLARTGASVGKSYRYRNEDGRLVFAGFLIRVKTYAPELNSDFLFQFFSTNQYWKWVSFISARSGQPGINGTEYSSMPISLPPTIKEQQEIASCLSTLDELIAAQAKNIEQLKLHKKGLMQGLFPKMND